MTYAEKLKELPEGFTFLVIGAADGKTLDPDLYRVIREKKGTGTFVEPLRDLFEMLTENYRDCKGIEFINAAIDNISGFGKINRVPIRFKDPEWLMGLGSFYDDRNALYEPSILPLVAVEAVRTITLEGLCLGISPDLLQIDTEGHDWVVFKQWKWSWGNPKLICIENMRLPKSERLKIDGKMATAGYQTFQDGDNLVATI